MSAPEKDFSERFWDIICEREALLKVALAFSVFILVALLLAAPGISQGSASYVIMIVDIALLAPVLVVVLFLLWRCRNREPDGGF